MMDAAIKDLLVDWMKEIEDEIDRWHERAQDERWQKHNTQQTLEAIILKHETRLAFLHRVIKRAGED